MHVLVVEYLNMTLEIHVQVASSPGRGDKANVRDKSVHKIAMKVVIRYTPKYKGVNLENKIWSLMVREYWYIAVKGTNGMV